MKEKDKDKDMIETKAMQNLHGKTSMWWNNYMVYCKNIHMDKKNSANYNLCGVDISFKSGTGGLERNLRHKHLTQYEEYIGTSRKQYNA